MSSTRQITEIMQDFYSERCPGLINIMPLFQDYFRESTYENLPTYVHEFCQDSKDTAPAEHIAKECLWHLLHGPSTLDEKKADEKAARSEIKQGIVKTQTKVAQGVANALSELDSIKKNKLFDEWAALAEMDEAKNGILCSNYRLLIIYYLPISHLKKSVSEHKGENLYEKYKLDQVRTYLKGLNFSNAPEQLLHVLKIKFALADNNALQVMSLICKSSLSLNIEGAELTDAAYLRGFLNGIALDYACLKDVKLNHPWANYYSIKPLKLNGADLSGMEIHHFGTLRDMLYNFSSGTTYDRYNNFVKQFLYTKQGLDIVFIESDGNRRTLLHFFLSSDSFFYHMPDFIMVLLKNGAAGISSLAKNNQQNVAIQWLTETRLDNFMYLLNILDQADINMFEQHLKKRVEEIKEKIRSERKRFLGVFTFLVGLGIITNFLFPEISLIIAIVDSMLILMSFMSYCSQRQEHKEHNEKVHSQLELIQKKNQPALTTRLIPHVQPAPAVQYAPAMQAAQRIRRAP